MSILESPPIGDSLIELEEHNPARKEPFYLAKGWLLWAYKLLTVIQTCWQFLKLVTLTNQSASIGATAVPLPGVSTGHLLVTWYARITTVDPVNSSLTVTIGWLEGGVALTLSGAAITGNLTTSVQGLAVPIQVDANSAITYATTYASNTPGTMRYSLRVTVTRIS